tara:strand:- start:13571 stop:13759 length:189 start_codon:yes stop_codon:yes gene_type:complete
MNHEKLIFWNPKINRLIIRNNPIIKKGVKINRESGFPKKLILSAPTKAKRKIVIKLIYCFKF